ncbi:MAG: hypothetical protein JRI71_16805 [Deltaproteobacteria bacterium]|nr:hypothetical protein [Deltaproteobacteria bacterium]
MPGAYTSTPIVAADPPDVPDGWDADWDFPGAFPPGYTPEYSLNLSATGSIAYDGVATATVSLRDHVTYTTMEPSGCSIIWTATIDGEAVNLRFSGDVDYESSISSSYSEGETYWGAAPEIEFELTGGNVGDTIMLMATSVVNGDDLAQSSEIAITVIGILEILYSYVADGANDGIEISCYMGTNDPSEGHYQADAKIGNLGGFPFSFIDDPGTVTDLISGSIDGDSIDAEFALSNLGDGQYIYLIMETVAYNGATISAEAVLAIGEEEYTKSLSNNSGEIIWLQIFNDGSVTVITP